MTSKGASGVEPQDYSPPPARRFPLCEGFLDKLALGRGVLGGSKGWKRRYVFVLPEGLGTCHKNPRESSAALANGAKDGVVRHLRPSAAKNFIPFEQRAGVATSSVYIKGDTVPTSCYLLTDLSKTMNDNVPYSCTKNGITRDPDPNEDSTSAALIARRGGNVDGVRYLYFAITFEESKKRYTLIFRTPDPVLYLQFTTYLRLYLHEGSSATVIPVAHPLELHHTPPTDVNIKKYVLGGSKSNSKSHYGQGESATDEPQPDASYYVPSDYTYVRDPDPCTLEELRKARQLVLSWNEGEMTRLIMPAMHFIRGIKRCTATVADRQANGVWSEGSACGGGGGGAAAPSGTAEAILQELLGMTNRDREQQVEEQLNTVGALLPEGVYDRKEGEESPGGAPDADGSGAPGDGAGPAKKPDAEDPKSIPSEHHNGLSDDTIKANQRRGSGKHADPLTGGALKEVAAAAAPPPVVPAGHHHHHGGNATGEVATDTTPSSTPMKREKKRRPVALRT